ncbi:MAG: hypothetical protein IPJ65_35665 [Archangiaceae bacterium]|nr:hypothetical protein [Archangiaceae bacterium]
MSLLLPKSGAAVLARVLESPELTLAVQGLPPAALGALVEKIGLEDAGELVAMATTEQVAAMLDEDLFADGDRLDSDRFHLWLEVMLEGGDAFAAQRLAELDEDLLTLALHRLVLVADLQDVPRWLSSRAAEKALSSSLGDELGNYQLLARHPDRWDAVFAALLALDRDHGALLERVLARCAQLTAELIDEAGSLRDALNAEASLDADVHGARDDRRGERGFVAASDARAFLAAARRDRAVGPRDYVTAQYLRQAAQAAPVAPVSGPSAALLQALGEAGVVPGRPRLPSGEAAPRFVQALNALRDRPALFAKAMSEVAYLCNVLVASGEQPRPSDALREVVERCSRGLEQEGGDLEALGADHFFKVGLL